MIKWSRLLGSRRRRLFPYIFLFVLIALINLYGYKGTYNYPSFLPDLIDEELYKAIHPNISYNKSNSKCNYFEVLNNTSFLEIWDVPKTYVSFSAYGIDGGEFKPSLCNPIFSVALIVTYRNRQSHMDVFLPYIHNFLRRQNIHYKIYIIEQIDNKHWNKGKLYNIGAKQAIADKFPCLILHDIDLLPLHNSNLYACTKQPRHMSASVDKFRFVLPYEGLVGGVLAITAEQYKAVNGFSNKFEGWGGEDDDFSTRLISQNLSIVRFTNKMSKYVMLKHPQEAVNYRRQSIIQENIQLGAREGYNDVNYQDKTVESQRLLTVVKVKL